METKGHTLETIEDALGVPRATPVAPAEAEKVPD
jgi:hypothetical protein